MDLLVSSRTNSTEAEVTDFKVPEQESLRGGSISLHGESFCEHCPLPNRTCRRKVGADGNGTKPPIKTLKDFDPIVRGEDCANQISAEYMQYLTPRSSTSISPGETIAKTADIVTPAKPTTSVKAEDPAKPTKCWCCFLRHSSLPD